MQIRIKKLNNDAIIPVYAKSGDAGLDLIATEVLEDTNNHIKYGTGLAIEIPEDYVGLIFPRSSVTKTNLYLANSVGVIDSGYRGEIMVVFNKTRNIHKTEYKIGDKVAQIIILPYPQIKLVEAEELSNTERGEGGFGSTGK